MQIIVHRDMKKELVIFLSLGIYEKRETLRRNQNVQGYALHLTAVIPSSLALPALTGGPTYRKNAI